MYVIKNGDYYLSNHYEKAAELVLGYGGVFAKKNIKKFKTKTEALREIKIMRACGVGSKNMEVIKL